jgi:hypothetical protein
MLAITCLECSLRNHMNYPSTTHSRMTCSMESTDLTPGMQILLILWFQDMYHLEGTKGNSSRKVILTYGMNRTFSEYALTAYSRDVCLLKKE